MNPDKPIKWAKTIVGYANGKGGVMFGGVSNEGEALGINLDEIDKTKNLIATINDRHIFPHARVKYMLRSVDANAERFVLAVNVIQALLLFGACRMICLSYFLLRETPTIDCESISKSSVKLRASKYQFGDIIHA